MTEHQFHSSKIQCLVSRLPNLFSHASFITEKLNDRAWGRGYNVVLSQGEQPLVFTLGREVSETLYHINIVVCTISQGF